MWLWGLAGVGAVFGVLGYVIGRRNARKLEQLSQSYWELRYQHGQLRAQVNRLDPEQQAAPEPASPAPGANFIPLSSLKR
jgi:outer membrane murein-binding lipoprotein Lpp